MTPDPSLDSEGSTGFDLTAQLAVVLRYLSHFRLMLICFAIGILAGVVYYVCGLPMYYSRAMVRITVLALPLNSDSGKVDGSAPSPLSGMGYFGLRAFQRALTSDLMQKRVAIRLGVATASESPEGIRGFAIPRVDIGFMDADHMEIGVTSPYPHVVREYASVLIDEYEKSEKENRDTFRKAALASYISEMDDYQAKLDEHLKQRGHFEESKSLAELIIKNNSLTQVPKEIVLTKYRIRRMEETRDYVSAHDKEMDTVAKLAMLNTVRNEKPVEVGSVVREGVTGTIQNSPPRSSQHSVDVVVEPSMVEALEPWQELEKQQRQLQEELRRKGLVFQPGHAVMRKLEADLAVVMDKLGAELDVAVQRFDVELASARERLKSLEAKLPEYHEVTAQYEKELQDYGLMEQGQLDWKRAHADMALNIAKLEFGADRDRVHMDFESMVNLRDVNPISPNKSKLVMIAFGLSLALAMGIPTLLIFTDTSVSHLQQLENKTGLRGIGVVPLTKPEVLEDIFRAPSLDGKVPSFVLETYRIIRNHICVHPGRNGRSQVVMITSARPSEGKTLLACNLAWAFHTMGEKTLLVDCDMRRGRVADITQAPNAPGISGLLTGSASEKEAILASGFAGLDVIPRGPVVAGATELLCQKKFEDLVAGWRLRYDRIVLDTPPVLGLGETSTIQRVTDGVVVVVRAHKTPAKDVGEATELLRKSGAHLFGLVLNAVDMSKMANYYNYYYYSAEYYEAMEAARPDK